MNTLLRLILLIWVIGYLAIACAPVFSGDVVSGGFGLIAGSVLLIPWLLGLVVIGALIRLTNSRRG